MSTDDEAAVEPFDLDVAVREAHGDSKPISFAGRVWQFPPTIPINVIRKAQTDVDGALAELLGGEKQAAELLEAGFSLQAFEIVLTQVYGFDLGEVSASSPLLNRAGRRSRQTSGTTTRSTSPKRASARKR